MLRESSCPNLWIAMACAGLLPVLFISSSALAAPILAWDISGGGVSSPGGVPRANGARFTVSKPSVISALGMFDHGADGLQQDHVVTLWSDTGDLLSQATVSTTGTTNASVDTNGQWIFESIDSIILEPQVFYRVAVGYTAVGGDEARSQTTLVSSLGANYIEQAYTDTGMGDATFPVHLNSNPVFGANLLIEAVPEPGTALLVVVGLIVLVRHGRDGRPVI